MGMLGRIGAAFANSEIVTKIFGGEGKGLGKLVDNFLTWKTQLAEKLGKTKVDPAKAGNADKKQGIVTPWKAYQLQKAAKQQAIQGKFNTLTGSISNDLKDAKAHIVEGMKEGYDPKSEPFVSRLVDLEVKFQERCRDFEKADSKEKNTINHELEGITKQLENLYEIAQQLEDRAIKPPRTPAKIVTPLNQQTACNQSENINNSVKYIKRMCSSMSTEMSRDFKALEQEISDINQQKLNPLLVPFQDNSTEIDQINKENRELLINFLKEHSGEIDLGVLQMLSFNLHHSSDVSRTMFT